MTPPVGLTARIERVLMELSVLMGETIPGPGPCSTYTRRISSVSEDELQEEDPLGKQPFVPKAILHWWLE